jgi:eukaryotic-like serine/threonine-protein kinase
MGAPTASGRVIAGRYRLIEALGSGGMGTVWRAQDELLHRQVAAKVIFPPAGVSAQERDRLREQTLREARIAARLSHPNVVTIYDVAEDDGQPWIIMELIKARSLREVVDRNGPLDPQAAAGLGLQLLAALRSAHAIGIMHRDVKPGNVLIDAGGRAVLADFGIARDDNSPNTTTTSGVVVGSPSYIAPERAQGERGGPGSDLWSLGATLYAAVEGRPPYERGGALPTLMAVVSEDPDPPRRAGAMWPVISGLLRADQTRRLSSAAAEQMLRRIAESGGAPPSLLATLPLPAEGLTDAAGAAGGGHPEPPDTLKDAERTRAFHPPASPVPEPPPRPAQRPGSPSPASTRKRGQPTPVSVPARAGSSSEEAVTPRTGFAVPGPAASDDQGPGPTAGPADGPAPATGFARAAEPGLIPAAPGDPPAPAMPSGLVSAPGRGQTGRSRAWPRRTRVIAAAIAAVGIAAAASGWYVADRAPAGSSASGHQGPAPAGSSATGHTPAAPASPGAGTPRSPQPRSGSTTTTPTSQPRPPSPTATASPRAGRQAIVPPGYQRYRDPTGFSIAVPDGWNVSHQGHYVYLTHPSGGSFLLIDQSDHPLPDPLANWRQQEANRRATYPGYRRLRLVAISYPQAEKAADWEFTYYRNGVLTHVLNRNILANARHAYALYWSAPQLEWAGQWHIFAVLARTFQPAA